MKKHKLTLSEIEHRMKNKVENISYNELYNYILIEIQKGSLEPIKASGTNGKTPALYNRYWEYEEEEDYSEFIQEMKYKLNPRLKIEYFLKNPDRYGVERKRIQKLSNYLNQTRGQILKPVTMNERSFEIFRREKYLRDEGGMELLKKLGISIEELGIYDTREPLAYYTRSRQNNQNILILENKDTFYSMRKSLDDGKQEILGVEIETLIYGAGKGIYKSFQDYIQGVEKYFLNVGNVLWYFGDLDYEGILIYETLSQMYEKEVPIRLFVPAYIRMIDKAYQIGVDELPDTKEKQNRNISMIFFENLGEEYTKKARDILEQNKYIPQEILNCNDY